MGDLNTISRLAQWKVQLWDSSIKTSNSFELANWQWRIKIQCSSYLNVQLSPDACVMPTVKESVAQFVLRVSDCSCIYESQFEQNLDQPSGFYWAISSISKGEYVIDVEIREIKPTATYLGTFPNPYLSRLLKESVHCDITIKTSDNGVLKTHKAILAVSSPVFNSMFLHDCIEKETSELTLTDMSTECCSALLGWLYGNITCEVFVNHRLPLLAAAHKYDISELKAACEVSLLEDIYSENVLERLQAAWIYQMTKLKNDCISYLMDMGKINDVQDKFDAFFKSADKDLSLELLKKALQQSLKPRNTKTISGTLGYNNAAFSSSRRY